MRSLRRLLPAVITVAALTLSACGTTDDAATDKKSSSGEKITVTDVRGKEVTINGPATRVVTLEWNQTEDVIALGVNPVGIADVKGFKVWDTAVKVKGDPVDVGKRNEPSQESVGKADPDLIIGSEESIPEDAIAAMEQIAPVVLLKGADANAPLERVRENFQTVAKLLGKDAEGEKILDELDQTLADSKTKIAAAKPLPYLFAYAYGEGSQVTFRVHAARSVPGAVAKEIGLTNAYAGPGDDAWGLESMDVEALTTLPADMEFLYWANSEEDPIKDMLPSNAVWTNLKFVKDGNVKPFGEGVWMYGGPRSLQQMAEAYVKALAS